MAEAMSDSWYDDTRITEAQLDAIRVDLGDNGRAQFSRAAMRKVMAETERLQGHLNAIADAHQDGVMARRRLDAIRAQEVAELKTRAETAERELDGLRALLGAERFEWAVRYANGDIAYAISATHARMNAERDQSAEAVRRVVGEWKAADDG